MEAVPISRDAYFKKYREEHPDKMKNYYKENKEKYNTDIICECGLSYKYPKKSMHYSRKKHIKAMALIPVVSV